MVLQRLYYLLGNFRIIGYMGTGPGSWSTVAPLCRISTRKYPPPSRDLTCLLLRSDEFRFQSSARSEVLYMEQEQGESASCSQGSMDPGGSDRLPGVPVAGRLPGVPVAGRSLLYPRIYHFLAYGNPLFRPTKIRRFLSCHVMRSFM